MEDFIMPHKNWGHIHLMVILALAVVFNLFLAYICIRAKRRQN